MENYNLNTEIIDDINSHKINFINSINKELNQLADLGLLDKKNIKNYNKYFLTTIIQNHLEIRENINFTRHFIMKKKDKLKKELKLQLYMNDVYMDLNNSTKDEYWKFMHTIFLLLETYHLNKDDAIINTLTLELEKEIEKEIDIKIDKEIKEIEDKIVKSKKKNYKMDKDLLSNFDFSKLAEITEQLSNNENGENIDILKMLKTFMPNMETSQNKSLMKDLMKDIKSSMTNIENPDEIFNMTKKLGEKYQKMIVDGNIDPNEILGSLMGLMTDESFSQELSHIDLSKLKPEDILGKMMSELSPDLINNMTGSIDGETDMNISSILSNMQNMGNKNSENQNKEMNTEQLTTEQIAEMEEYYSNINLKVE